MDKPVIYMLVIFELILIISMFRCHWCSC